MKSKWSRVLTLVALAGSISLISFGPCVADEVQAAPGQVSRPGVVRWQVGQYEVFALSDTRVRKAPSAQSSHVAYAVRKGASVVLINAGRGIRQGPDFGQVADNLKSLGIAPEEVAAVFLTSMHADMVSGLVVQGEQRQYPNAQLFASSAAMQHWLADHSYVQAPDDQKLAFATTITSVMPYVKAGKLQAVEEGLALMPGMTMQPMPGSTPGCVGYLIESGGKKLLITSDQVVP